MAQEKKSKQSVNQKGKNKEKCDVKDLKLDDEGREMKEEVEMCGQCKKPKGHDPGSCRCGRPCKYHKGIPEEMIDYFDRSLTKIETKKCNTKTGGTFWLDDVVANDFPTLEEYAFRYVGISIQTLNSWKRWKNKDGSWKYKKLREAYFICKQLQLDFLVKNGISGKLNPMIAKLVAINLTHMKDEKSITHKGDEDNPIQTKEVKATRDMSDEELQEELEIRMRDKKPENAKK